MLKVGKSCEWATQSWHWVEKLMWMSNVDELCEVDIEFKNSCQWAMQMSNTKLSLSWKTHANKPCK